MSIYKVKVTKKLGKGLYIHKYKVICDSLLMLVRALRIGTDCGIRLL